MKKEIPPRYDREEMEGKMYRLWEESGYCDPDRCVKDGITAEDATPFSIVLPPPNVTGDLHMGHAAMLVVEDIMVRYARMCGKRTLWIPGTDHAAIATQSKVESLLYKKEKTTRHDLGREEFLKRVTEFAAESHDAIVHQIQRLGASLDWSREAYTLDKERTFAVRAAFKKMYDLGIIYRGDRIVNWDPKMQTTVSDDELEWIEETVPLYYLKYGPFEIATARPETKFGDKYVVVHPDDPRYAAYHDGQEIRLEWINGPITATIVKDPAIDMGFGTGAMTITPWHDAVDFAIAERRRLSMEPIIDLQGRLLPIAGEFTGQHIGKARPMIARKLKSKGLLLKTDEQYVHRVAANSRGGGIIEPQILKQWFVNVDKQFHPPNPRALQGSTFSLRNWMRDVVNNGIIQIYPEAFKTTYNHWIDSLHDWCISRQIWFGHRIPVWYCTENKKSKTKNCEEPVVSVEDPATCPSCGGTVEQDPDTLDTWFSSGLWPFSALGWPKDTRDLNVYFPTSMLETGYDILFFWVARMILMAGALLGDIPFREVYLHGLVRDIKGKKMSKTAGNGIDPLLMANAYGADATRLSLVIGAAPGNDIKLSEDKIRGYRNFATKIWNVGRFVLMNKPEEPAANPPLSNDERAYLAECTTVKKEVTQHIEEYNFHLAGETAYHYLWHTLADKIVEAEKDALRGEDPEKKAAAYHTLETILLECLRMLHPFMPFITEALWQKFRPGRILMVERWDGIEETSSK